MPAESAKKEDESSAEPVDTEVCRICRLTTEESGSALEHSGCHCTGSMSLCHRECLEKWMVYQRSRVCELCHGLFQFELDETKVSENIQKELRLARNRHALGCRSRRIWYLICTCMLAVTASTAATLTVYTIRFDDNLDRRMTPPTPGPGPLPWSNWTTTTTMGVAPAERDRPEVFCIVVTVWLVASFVVIVSLWVFVELVLWPREAQLMVNVAWFSILYEIYERFVAAEQGNILHAINASSREATTAAAAAADAKTTATAPKSAAASTQETSPKNSA